MTKNNLVKLMAVLLVATGLGYAIFANAQSPAQTEGGAPAADKVASFAPTEMTGDAWLVRCNDKKPEEVAEKRGKCEIFQQQIVKESGQRLVEFAIGFPEGNEDARGIIILPLGIALQKDVSMGLDGGAAFNFKVRYCLANGCYGYMTLTNDVLNQMKAAGKVAVGIESADGKKISLELPLVGFGKALDQIS